LRFLFKFPTHQAKAGTLQLGLQSNPIGATVFPLTQHVPSLCCLAPPFNAILHHYKGVVFVNSAITSPMVNDIFQEDMPIPFFINQSVVLLHHGAAL
jgi:hypothetical protein